MNRDTLRAILSELPGLTQDGDSFRIGDQQVVAFHLGESSRTAVIREIQRGALRETFLTFTTNDSEQTFYLPYEGLSAVSAVPARKQGRAGFA